MEAMTFKKLYEMEREKDKQTTAAKQFILRCMEATKKSENTVRGWLCGSRTPEKLEREALAREFGCTAEELFPNTNEGKEACDE
jgi:hypothetical protein